MMMLTPVNSYFPTFNTGGNTGSINIGNQVSSPFVYPQPVMQMPTQAGYQTTIPMPNQAPVQMPVQPAINPPSYVTPYPSYGSTFGNGGFVQQPQIPSSQPYSSYYGTPSYGMPTSYNGPSIYGGPSMSQASWGNLLNQMGMMMQGFMGWFSIGANSGVSPYTSNPAGTSVAESSYGSTLEEDPVVPTMVYPTSYESPLTSPTTPSYTGSAPNYGSQAPVPATGQMPSDSYVPPANTQSGNGEDTYAGMPDYTQYEQPSGGNNQGQVGGGGGSCQQSGGGGMQQSAGSSNRGGRRGGKSHRKSGGGGHCSNK